MAQVVDKASSVVNNPDCTAIWVECSDILQKNINPETYSTWFSPIVPISMENSRFVVQVPSRFHYEWLEQHYQTVIRAALAQVIGEEVTLVYNILQKDERQAFAPMVETKKNIGEYMGDDTHLNSRYTFENFVEGKGNQFAKAATLAVSEKPGKTSFNPLVLYSGVGLGKTHLLQAIGNFAKEKGTAKRIRYVSSEKFTIDFINAIQNNRTSEFSQIYRTVDLLLVDDIHFLLSKERTQEEFFHTFNTLHQKGKQIVLTSDRPPKELVGLEERLISRFQWGLVAEIQPPDLETRIAILQQKAEYDGIVLPVDIIEFIATNIKSNIRELEGALIKLLAYSSLKGMDINIELAKIALNDILITKKRDVSIEQIQRVVCEYYAIPDDLLRGKSRKQEIAWARQVAMYFCKEMTRFSLKSIGLHFGGRDHTTVIHAVRTIAEGVKKGDKNTLDQIETVRKKIEVAVL
jgi:chromosomal replication initiator protein